MANLDLAKTVDTPEVFFDEDEGVFRVEGESYPENAMEFYRPIIEVLTSYVKEKQSPIKVTFKMMYFNSSSSKCLLDIFDILEEFVAAGNGVSVHWFYQEDDEDIKESGEDFAEDLNLDFSLISYP